MEEARRPQFFKVLMGDFARRIEVPQAFLCHIPAGSRKTSETTVAACPKFILLNADGKTWTVGMEETDGRAFLTTGWPKFVEDNRFGQGEFLIFKFDGNVHFVVSVFGVNSVEKSVGCSGTGAAATGNLEGKLPCDIFPSRDGNLTDMAKSPTHSHSQTITSQSIQRDEHISSQDELEIYMSVKQPMEDGKAKAIAKVMRMLNVDRLTVELFCAALSLHKWNVDVAAEDFDICRGKPQISELSLKQKIVSQFNFVKEQLQHFFPPDDDSSESVGDRRKNDLEGPNMSKQPQHCDSSPAKRKLVDEHDSCDLSHQQKRRLGKLQQGSPQIQMPRRSLRLAHLKTTCNSTNNILKERSKAPKPSLAPVNHVMNRADKSCLLHEKQDSVLKGVRGEVIGSLCQDVRKVEPTRGEVALSEQRGRNIGETKKELDQGNDEENNKEQTRRNALGTSESFMSTGRMETVSLPTNAELSFTWKHPQHSNPLEKILFEIERDNFMNTIAHVQEIIRDDLSDVQTADVIEAVVRMGIFRRNSCLQDSSAQRIVNAMLEHAKKVKEKLNFDIEVRKKEFSAKLQDHLKWQRKELETRYTSLELDYTKATTDASTCFSTLEEHRQKLRAIQDDIKGLQQAMMTKEDELQKWRLQVSEHETLFQKSIMERVKVKMALKSYQLTLNEVKRTEPSSVDVEALVKADMDNVSKEIEVSKRRLLSINFKNK